MFCSLCAGSITTFSLYGPLLQTHLRYNQFQVNAVSISGELSQYLLLPLIGFICDRYGPRVLALASAVFFSCGYLLAAITYRNGPTREGGWSYRIMVIAFVGIGLGTCCLVLSSVTTCAKNFGKSRYKGLALSLPIVAFGLSGMWLSQVGSQLLYEPKKGGGKGDIDVYRFFLFLTGLLFAVGLVGAFTFKVVNEDELINEAVSELEQGGFLDESAFNHGTLFHNRSPTYGTMSRSSSRKSSVAKSSDNASLPSLDAAIKSIILNTETRLFFADPNTWLLAAGFFFASGPGETFINNLGSVINTLYPPPSPSIPPFNSPATNISVVAIASTVTRLLAGTFSDFLSPSPLHSNSPRKFTLSRVVFLLTFDIALLLAQLLLATGLVQNLPNLFPLISALFGIGYGGIFSLIPIVVSTVWGVRNFGTNWGIIMTLPAVGAAAWSVIYSAIYQAAADAEASHDGRGGQEGSEILCYGLQCYQGTFAGMAICSIATLVVWSLAWRNWRRAGIRV